MQECVSEGSCSTVPISSPCYFWHEEFRRSYYDADKIRYDSKWRGTPGLLVTDAVCKADPGEQKGGDRPGRRRLQIATGTIVVAKQVLQGSSTGHRRRKSRERFGNLAYRCGHAKR